MKNLDPNSGLRQVSSGKLYLPRRIILELIRNKTLTPNDLGYLIMALISADWNEGEYRYGFIRHETKKLAKIWNISYQTLQGGFVRLFSKGLLGKELKTYFINNFEYFEKARTYKNTQLTNEDLKDIFGNSLLESEISKIKNEISDSNSSKTSQLLNVSHKVDINVINQRTIADYQRIYVEGNYTLLTPEDMRWIDDHYDSQGRCLP